MIQKCNSKQQRKNTINRARRGTRHEETSKTERNSEKEMKKLTINEGREEGRTGQKREQK
jgi:hypothetical protein